MPRKQIITAMASTLRFLGDASRCTVLLLLEKEKQGLYVFDVAKKLGLSHSATSHQLGALEVRGLVEHTREGQLMRYALTKTPATKQVLAVLKIFR